MTHPAFTAALRVELPETVAALDLPPGVTKRTETLTHEKTNGRVYRGAGRIDFPADYTKGWSRWRDGSLLHYAGDDVAIRAQTTVGLCFRDLSVDASGGVGLSFKNVGLGNESLKLDNVGFLNCRIGAQYGVEGVKRNSSEVVRQSVLYKGCEVGDLIGSDQSVNHTFKECDWLDCGTCVRVDAGGCATFNHPTVNGAETFLQVNKGGKNAAMYNFFGGRVDHSDTAPPITLVDASKVDGMVVINLFGVLIDDYNQKRFPGKHHLIKVGPSFAKYGKLNVFGCSAPEGMSFEPEVVE